jgi:uncharacterized membrane protein YedE/YeeE
MPSSWIHGLAGGVLIGLSSALMLGLYARVAGISGLLRKLWLGPAPRWPTALFLGGLVLGAGLAVWIVGPVVLDFPLRGPWLALAGLCVGLGTHLANGCTSGHAVCGLARLSPRSLAATLTFMAVAMLTVFALRTLGLR